MTVTACSEQQQLKYTHNPIPPL